MARAESQPGAQEKNCVRASVFGFTQGGTTTYLNVPEGSEGQVVKLAAKKDYAGLKKLSSEFQCEPEKFQPPYTDIV